LLLASSFQLSAFTFQLGSRSVFEVPSAAGAFDVLDRLELSLLTSWSLAAGS
jgi:hypothetical protein